MPSVTLTRYFYLNIGLPKWPWPLGSHVSHNSTCNGPKHIGVTTSTFLGHVTTLFTWPIDPPLCHFLLVFYWNRVSILNRFRDVYIQIYLGHDLDLSESRDVTCHVTVWFPSAISYRCSIVNVSLSSAIFEIMGPKHIGVTTLTFLGHATSSVTWPNDKDVTYTPVWT